MTQGSLDSAAEILKQVVALQPQDRLSAQLLESLTAKPEPGEAVQPTNPQQVAAAQTATAPPAAAGSEPGPAQTPIAAEPPPEPSMPTSPVPAKLVGSWSANPAKDVTIGLSLGGITASSGR